LVKTLSQSFSNNSLLKIFPKADIYTAVFNEEEYKELENEVFTTFLQKPFFKVLIPFFLEQTDKSVFQI